MRARGRRISDGRLAAAALIPRRSLRRAPALALAALAALAAGCGEAHHEVLEPMTIEQHQHSGVTVPRLETVRTSADWVALWNQHVAPRVPPPAPPAIDFQQRMVLGVFVGQRPTGCHQVQIERVEVFGTAFIRASYRETVPGPAAVCPAVVTHPAHLVSVRVLHRIPVEFFELPPQTVGGGAAPAANDADPTRGQ